MLIKKFNSAGNNHNVEEALSFLEPNGQLILDGEIVAQGKDQMRECMSHCMTNKEYFCQLIQFLPATDGDRVRVRSKTNDNRQYEETYVFSKENSNQFIQIFAQTVNTA